MCLIVKKVKKKPLRRTAWKVVGKDRTPRHFSLPRNGKYLKGRTVKIPREAVRVTAFNTVLEGLHVYTSLGRAKKNMKDMMYWMRLIKVQVSPKDWVADGLNGEAVYCKLKVLT